MNPHVLAKLEADKKDHVLGRVRFTHPDVSTRATNTFIEPKSPRMANVLNMIAMLPNRRYFIMTEDEGVALVLSSILGRFRKVVYGHEFSLLPKNPFTESFDITHFEPALKAFNRLDYDTLIFAKLNHGTHYRITGDDVVLCATMDMSEDEAREFTSRLYRPMLDPAIVGEREEDTRLCLYLTREASEAFIKEEMRHIDSAIGFKR